MKIFINPGHSVDGEDHGACANGLTEAFVALDISQRVGNYLREAGCEVNIGQFDWLDEICEASNSWGANIFISIHCNAATSPYAQGTETFCVYGATAGRELAECIQTQIVNSLPVENRGVREAAFAVLTGTTCPAVLVETAFVTNVHDAELLADKPDDFARAIARGVTDYLQSNSPRPDVVDTQG